MLFCACWWFEHALLYKRSSYKWFKLKFYQLVLNTCKVKQSQYSLWRVLLFFLHLPVSIIWACLLICWLGISFFFIVGLFRCYFTFFKNNHLRLFIKIWCFSQVVYFWLSQTYFDLSPGIQKSFSPSSSLCSFYKCNHANIHVYCTSSVLLFSVVNVLSSGYKNNYLPWMTLKSLTFQKFIITGFHFKALSFQNRSDPHKKKLKLSAILWVDRFRDKESLIFIYI